MTPATPPEDEIDTTMLPELSQRSSLTNTIQKIHHVFEIKVRGEMDGAFAVMPYYDEHIDINAHGPDPKIMAADFQFGRWKNSPADLSKCRLLVRVREQDRTKRVELLYIDVSHSTTYGTHEDKIKELQEVAEAAWGAGKTITDQRINIEQDSNGQVTLTAGTGTDAISVSFKNAGQLIYSLPPLVVDEVKRA